MIDNDNWAVMNGSIYVAVGSKQECETHCEKLTEADPGGYVYEVEKLEDNPARFIDAVMEDYNERIMALLKRCRDVVREAGMASDDEPYEMHDDEYRWYLPIWRSAEDYGNYEKSIAIGFEIAESQSYGDGPADGINFGISIVDYGGRILGGLSPYNYTDQCWVPASDREAVAERWQIIEGADMESIPHLINS